MIHLLLVDISECFGGLNDIASSFSLRYATKNFHFICQCTVLTIFHRIVGGIILFEHFNDSNNIWMAQFCNISRFFEEFFSKSLHSLTARFGAKRYIARAFSALAEVSDKELFYSYFTIERSLLRQVGNAKTSLAEHFEYLIFAALKRGVRLKRLHMFRISPKKISKY